MPANTRQVYGDFSDCLLCLGIALLLGIQLPSMRNPEGHNPRYWRKHPPVGRKVLSTTREQRPFRIFAWKDAASWMLQYPLGWVVVGPFLGLCVTAAVLLAQEHWYVSSRSIWSLAAVLLLVKSWHHIWWKSELTPEGKRSLSLLVSLLICAFFCVILWTLSALHRAYLEALPRADVRVDNVTLQIQNFGDIGTLKQAPGSVLPAAVVARIQGENASFSTPTEPYPIVQASIAIRPVLRAEEEEDELFKNGGWANETYVGMPYVLNPRQAFSFEKKSWFSVIDAKGIKDTGNMFFDNWNALQRGDVVIYVVTKTLIKDKWGDVPQVKTCKYFVAADQFSREHTCDGQFIIGKYQK
jgi:hypothetical protein